jgi:mRNA interferase RelE/StbE
VARYSIRIKRSAIKELELIPARADRQRIVSSISALAENPRPHGSLKLSGRELYRLRKGRYRILYSIEDRVLVVQVVRIGHRKNVYIKKK